LSYILLNPIGKENDTMPKGMAMKGFVSRLCWLTKSSSLNRALNRFIENYAFVR